MHIWQVATRFGVLRRARRGRAASLIFVFFIFASATVSLNSASAAVDKPTAVATSATSDTGSALIAARTQGRRVEVTADRTALSTTWAQPDGQLTEQIYEQPVRFLSGGKWVDVNLTLADSDGVPAPIGDPWKLRFSPGGGSADQEQSLASLLVNGRDTVFGWHGALPKPRLAGSMATYPNVSPGIDLILQATTEGFNASLVLHRPSTWGYTVTLPIAAPGMRLTPLGPGRVGLVGPTGTPGPILPAPTMSDSQVDPRSLESTHSGTVVVNVADRVAGAQRLVLTADARFLESPTTRYPVTVDLSPTVNTIINAELSDSEASSQPTNHGAPSRMTVDPTSTVLDTYVKNTVSTPEWTSTDLLLGTYDGGTDVARSFLQFPVPQLINTQIDSATLNLYEYWSSYCAQDSWQVWLTGVADESTVWSNQPSWVSLLNSTTQTDGYPSSCGGTVGPGWVSVDVASQLQYGGDHGYTYASLGVRATSETDSTSWKRFYSANNGGADVPNIEVNYTPYPMASSPAVSPSQQLTSGATASTFTGITTPTLSAATSDPDQSQVLIQWDVYDAATNTEVIQGLNGSWVTAGGTSSATVPAGTLLNGHTYQAWPWAYSTSGLWARQTLAAPLTFTVEQYESAFQANTGSLCTLDSFGALACTTDEMARGTSPAITALPGGGYELAFQGTNTDLYVYGPSGLVNTQDSMAPGTSPAIAALPNGGYQVAFQANNTDLCTWTSTSGATLNTTEGMASGTSPAIAALTSGGYELAFQGNNSNLYLDGPNGLINTQDGMMSGTSPVLAASASGGYQAAFQANNTNLYTWTSTSGATLNTTEGMASGTSPAIAALTSGGYELAFQGNNSYLYLDGPNGLINTQQGMMSGTSPSFAAAPTGGYQAAFQANNTNLYTADSFGWVINTQDGMMAGTSPAVA